MNSTLLFVGLKSNSTSVSQAEKEVNPQHGQADPQPAEKTRQGLDVEKQ